MSVKSTSVLANAFFAFLLLTGTSLFANPVGPAKPASFEASVYVTKSNKIRLVVEKTTAQPISIILRQVGKSSELFTQQMVRKQTKLALELNVDQLADGTYELEIRSATGSLIKQVSLATTAPQQTTERTITMP
ncbi:hypothetical protein [Spirosoma arcticum]